MKGVASEQARRFTALEKKAGINWVPSEFWRKGDWMNELSGAKIVKEFPGKNIFDLCPEPGWLDTHHAPAAEVEYINRKLNELGMKAGTHGVHH